MKIIVGVDFSQQSKEACQLVQRLQLPQADIILTHTMETFYPNAMETFPMQQVGAIEQYVALQENEAKKHMGELTQWFVSHGTTVKSEIRRGFIANQLLEAANEENADLIALGSGGKSALASFFVGSVSRKVVSDAKQSVLIAKNGIQKNGPLKVVFATDHSPYSLAAAEHLARWKPKGIAEITVMTAYPSQLLDVMKSVMENYQGDVRPWVERQLTEQNKEVIKKLAGIGCPVEQRLVANNANEGIDIVMKDTGADLLVLGAVGHGFFDRLTLGSVSFHQAVATAHPVLILRPQM